MEQLKLYFGGSRLDTGYLVKVSHFKGSPVFLIFILVVSINFYLSSGVHASTRQTSLYSPNYASFIPTQRRISRQLSFGDGGGRGAIGQDLIQPYQHRQQQSEANFFQSMMSLNFDLTEVFAMYRNVTAVAETPACLGLCRTPIALWMIQSFYPCYNLKKMDCPRGLVCCMQDPNTRLPSANTVHDSRVKIKGPPLASSIRRPPVDDSQSSPSSSISQDPSGASRIPESTTLFDEEYFKNNFIQDELPDD